MNTPVNFELAKLLKEKEYDKYANLGYTKKGEIYLHQGGQEPVKNKQQYYEGREYLGGEFYCSAPTIAEVVMWLYEKYGVWISVIDVSPSHILWEYQISRKEVGLIYSSDQYPVKHNYSPTEAYEAAIEYTLKNLI